MKELLVLGTGGHAKVVIATAEAAGFTVTGAYDDDPARHGQEILGTLIRGTLDEALQAQRPIVIAIGDNRARQRLSSADVAWATLVHPSAVVHESVQVSAGTVIFARCVVQPSTQIGRHVILNTGCSVDHDCRIGDFAHIAPGASLCGGVSVGEGSLIGVGAAMVPGVSLGNWSTVGGGAAVTRSFGDDLVLVGVPARPKAAPAGK